jgi:hypothetical protein
MWPNLAKLFFEWSPLWLKSFKENPAHWDDHQSTWMKKFIILLFGELDFWVSHFLISLIWRYLNLSFSFFHFAYLAKFKIEFLIFNFSFLAKLIFEFLSFFISLFWRNSFLSFSFLIFFFGEIHVWVSHLKISLLGGIKNLSFAFLISLFWRD